MINDLWYKNAVIYCLSAGTYIRNAAVFAIRYDWRDNSVLFVHNLASTPREVSFSAGLVGDDGQLLVDLLSENNSKVGSSGIHHLILEAYGYRWNRVGGLDYLLKRSNIETSSGVKRRGKERKSNLCIAKYQFNVQPS